MNLIDIQKLAKTDKKSAEEKLLVLTREIFPQLSIQKILIDQKSYSLNSVFGFITIERKEYFFKFHSEEGEEKTLKEYYNSELLSKNGFPTLLPVYKSTKPGKQFLIYKKISDPNVFDVLDRLEKTYLKNKTYDQKLKTKLIKTEESFYKQIIKKSLQTLKTVPAKKVAKEEINQLFYNRLVSDITTPRLDLFYKNKSMGLPNGTILSFEDLKRLHWNIDGVLYKKTIDELIIEAKRLLNPLRLTRYPVITGHGDDHNGNKFFTKKGFVYFDPAFAGENQYALLTFIKTTFHDCLAHPLWLYDPKDFNIELYNTIKKNVIEIETNFNWISWAPVREELLWIKIKQLWVPLIKKLKSKNLLEKEWEIFIRSALFTCPFLVYNLIDEKRISPLHSLFALSQCVVVGSKSKNGPMEKYFEYMKEMLN